MSKSRLFITKPLDQLIHESKDSGGLKRSLSALNLTTLGIGAIIGAGIFVLTGQAAAQYAGLRLYYHSLYQDLLRFCRLMLCGVRLHDPDCGSAYTYSYATLGNFLPGL